MSPMRGDGMAAPVLHRLTGHYNVSHPARMTAGELSLLLLRGPTDAMERERLAAVLLEADEDDLTDLHLAGIADYRALAARLRECEGPADLLDWTDERARLELAAPA